MTQVWILPMSSFIFLGGMVYSLQVTSNRLCRLQVVSNGLDCCVGVHPWWVTPRYRSRVGRWLSWKWVYPDSYGGSHPPNGTYVPGCVEPGQNWRMWSWLPLELNGLWLWIASGCSRGSAFSSPCRSTFKTHSHRSVVSRPKCCANGFWVMTQLPVSRRCSWACRSAT